MQAAPLLRNAWAYMYDGELPGIGVHADDAGLNPKPYLKVHGYL